MNILVCIKQVPDTTEIKIDPVTNTLIREGVPSIVNTFDQYALEMAVQIKDKDPDTKVIVASMGPPQAEVAIKTCLSVGADKGYLICGREFAGADTLSTSYIISRSVEAIEKLEGIKFDAIFCGKQAIDGDTAQVGPEMAEHLGIPQITYAIEAEFVENKLRVKRETEDGYEIREAACPCLITVTKPAFEPRYATVKSKMAANRAKVPMLGVDDMDIDIERCGLKGSATKVKKTFVPIRNKNGIKIKEETPEESVAKLVELLTGAGVI